MKILIIGYKGMLGNELVKVFKSGNNLTLWDKEQIDISNRDDVMTKVGKLKPDVVINAAAYTAVDKAESEKDLVYKINGCAIGFLSTICKEINALFIHFSTDYVFDGESHIGYKENHLYKPINLYGKSKALGEKMILDIKPRYYLIRTSWLFGKYGKNFIETMIRLAEEGKDLKVVNDQFGSPTYAKDLAKKVKELIKSEKPYGIYHITNSENCNWYEFAQKIFEFVGLKPNLRPVTSEEFPTLAKRPTYSMLVNTKISLMRPWEEALKAYLIETGRIK
ncbi:MAG: dTDP-4-dehydrorhamnose reductase [Candidatus Pacebacteria bacterium]|nr:dTDP-4-dehydrorhamnose reductase [Candidatus Paceibacterota bacterium]